PVEFAPSHTAHNVRTVAAEWRSKNGQEIVCASILRRQGHLPRHLRRRRYVPPTPLDFRWIGGQGDKPIDQPQVSASNVFVGDGDEPAPHITTATDRVLGSRLRGQMR
ncbi:hypothetical protein, partial [Xanthobacter wiegelii]|uniref:hypothetical protein n=1 Tax=Xanthobacter wiegelii TaxID=3119913 RepID=UPI003728ECB4